MFLRMLLFTVVSQSLQIALCVITLMKNNERTIEPFGLVILNAISLQLSLICLGFVTYLLVYHGWLIHQNLSTFQHIQV